MKKTESIVFNLNVSDLENKRLLSLYRRLKKNASLAAFSREAFMEKAERIAAGHGEYYTKLNSLIKAKGIPFILEAVQEKETGTSLAANEATEVEKAALQILEAVRRLVQSEVQEPSPLKVSAVETPRIKPDMEKLKALL